jgi:transcriptional regulator with XRE-family HTH domain
MKRTEPRRGPVRRPAVARWGFYTYGQQIKRARLALSMTQAEAAEFVGVNMQTLARWEEGRTEPPDLRVPMRIHVLIERGQALEEPGGEQRRGAAEQRIAVAER